jgi:cell division protease FtsH
MRIPFFLVCNLLQLCSAFQHFPKFKFEYKHLDTKTMEKLEKMFYLKNRRYSPYKNKFTQSVEPYNVSELLDNINKEFMKNLEEEHHKMFEEMEKDDEEEDDDDEDEDYYEDDEDDDDEEDNDDIFERLTSQKAHSKGVGDDKVLGYIDTEGIYRYKTPTIFISKGSRDRTRGGGGGGGSGSADEFGGDGNFQILRNPEYSFKDVGGYQKIKSELLQISDILLNFDKYKKYNVRTPKGIIFEGPPGNGKTLMAKGFSGELKVNFIPVSGSEFSEKYVGVGASRVRELFKLADENKPCIIFIDEIDALARKRGSDSVSSNSEKDQTLNQLLINLDGFKQSNGVFVIGATNRIDLLDPALMRPGRIDKNIFIGNPDAETRKAILDIHLSGKPLENGISVEELVEMTGGFSGAQIENLLNESMLKALRDNREFISKDDLEYIMNRVLAGWQSTESKYSDDIIQRIAIHEMGHAVVGFFSKHHSKLVKVCLNLWSPKSPGYTIFESSEENINIYTKDGLFSHLMVLLGGRIAEELFFGYSVTTGARKDLDEAYKLAQSMILQYGMGKQNIYPDLSDQSKYLIDQEVNQLLLLANDQAAAIISNSREFILETSEILKQDSLLKPEQMNTILKSKYADLLEIYNTTDDATQETV